MNGDLLELSIVLDLFQGSSVAEKGSILETSDLYACGCVYNAISSYVHTRTYTDMPSFFV